MFRPPTINCIIPVDIAIGKQSSKESETRKMSSAKTKARAPRSQLLHERTSNFASTVS